MTERIERALVLLAYLWECFGQKVRRAMRAFNHNQRMFD